MDKILGQPAETLAHPHSPAIRDAPPDPLGPAEPVRVGRFEWERLMLMSPLPRATKTILLALGVFMSEDGGDARPGLENLAIATGRGRSVLIEHLAVAVAAGYLYVVERGGFRGKSARATEYAAVAPKQVWVDRERILRAPPWRRAREDRPTSGNPDVDRHDERPENRTLVHDEGPVFENEGPVFASRTSGKSDPTTQLHHAPNTTSPLPPVVPDAPSSAGTGEGEGFPDQTPNPHQTQAARLTEPYANRMRAGQRIDLETQIAAALARGWSPEDLERDLAARHNGLNDLGAGLIARIRNLKQPPAPRPRNPEPTAADAEQCPIPGHRDLARNCGTCWGSVKGGQDPYAGQEGLRPAWWHDVYRRPTRRTRQETRG